jgi:hypothetical protein
MGRNFKMNDMPKFQYGELLKVKSTPGLDLPTGEIVIMGICNPDCLPSYIDFQAWAIGEAEFDFDLATQPWYFFKYTDRDEDETYDLPQFAMEEAVDAATRK